MFQARTDYILYLQPAPLGTPVRLILTQPSAPIIINEQQHKPFPFVSSCDDTYVPMYFISIGVRILVVFTAQGSTYPQPHAQHLYCHGRVAEVCGQLRHEIIECITQSISTLNLQDVPRPSVPGF